MGYETLLEQIKAVCAWNSLPGRLIARDSTHTVESSKCILHHT